MAPGAQAAIADALRLLGVRRLVLSIQDPSFPPGPDDDTGRGTPYSPAGLPFLELVRSLGFDAVQLGPQGQTSRANPSPYDGTVFARNTTSLGLATLARDARRGWLLREESVARFVGETPPRGAADRYRHAFDASRAALGECYARYRAGLAAAEPAARELADELAAFRAAHASWLVPYALYEVLEGRHGGASWRDWPEPDAALYGGPEDPEHARRRDLLAAQYEPELEAYALGQLLAHEQHDALRERLRRVGLAIYGDLQIGLSQPDLWARRAAMLPGYLMGAPPSRTNPAGQPWGYPVPHPARELDAGAPGWETARIEKALAEYDGLRIDHPPGIVCPWVYRADDPDPFHAVQHGARLFCSPDLPDHPALAALAIARPDQIDRALPRHADGWVRALDDAQVARYARVVDAIVAALGGNCAPDRVVCEVLSTQPYPLVRVMERHGLGRFRVTQKARLDDPGDVYRAENARPEDWIMVGNHDTPSIWELAGRWHRTAEGAAQASHLARVLRPRGGAEALEATLAGDPRALVHAKVAELFTSPAAHVLVFFADLFGLEATYNRPGVVSDENWSLRLPDDYAERYFEASARGEAIDVPCVLALALRARSHDRAGEEVAARLERLARYRIAT